jgi:hypothetical protein
LNGSKFIKLRDQIGPVNARPRLARGCDVGGAFVSFGKSRQPSASGSSVDQKWFCSNG